MIAVEFESGIEDAWSDVATFVPKLAAFLVVLVIGYIVVKIIARVLNKLITRSGFERALERGGIKQFFDRSGTDVATVTSKVVFWFLFLMVLRAAFGVFGENPVSDMLAGVVAYLPKVIAAILIVVIVAAIASAARDLIATSMGGLSYGRTVASGAAIAIVTVGIFAALNQLQIAPEIVNGLFYALLAIVAGSAIVAIGGGGVGPMQQRWRQMLDRYDAEKPRMQVEMQRARQAREHNGMQPATGYDSTYEDVSHDGSTHYQR
jgi:hypothetical protein